MSLLLCGPHSYSWIVVQEMTCAGVFVRMIGVSVLRFPTGVAVSAGMIAVSCDDGPEHVHTFDVTNGRHIRSFGVHGTSPGQLGGANGLRFTPSGCHILVAERTNSRLSLFTLTGDFVRCIGEGMLSCPVDVDFASNGDILVADEASRRVYVFSADGCTLLRSFGGEGTEPGLFQCPTALAAHADELYVLDATGRVQVFQ